MAKIYENIKNDGSHYGTMARPLRNLDPKLYHLVTVRTLEARIWMVPSEKLNKIIGGILARYQEIYGVVIYNFCILGNHLHIVLKTTLPNLDQFMENVLREIARRVNRHIGRRGYFWSRRYDDQVILSEEDLLEAFLYTATNPVKHGLVKQVASWPGLHGYDQLLDENERTYPFVHYSQRNETGNVIVTFHKLILSPLPQFENLNKGARVSKVKKLINDREQELIRHRSELGQGFLGAIKINTQLAGRRPVTVSYSPRPICYTKDPEIKRHYKAERRIFRAAYREASISFRSGQLNTKFPPHCFKPPLHRVPKSSFG